MRVEGLKILDSNYYQQITIYDGRMVVQRYDKVGRLVSKDYGPKRTASKQRLSLLIKKLDDKAVMSIVTDYFLDYVNIDAIYENLDISGKLYPIVVDSTIGKRLRFSTNPSDEALEKIRARYKFDRDEFLIGLEDYRNFVFGYELGKSFYTIDSNDSKTEGEEGKTRKVLFCLAAENDENFGPRVRDDELEFFGRAISTIMGNRIADATVYEDSDRFGFITRDYLITDEYYERQIHIPNGLFPVATKYVSEHNQRVWSQRREQEKIEGNVYQMKMEEF